MYDLIVIGGGPGGYSAALTGKKLGKSVLLIEKDKLGGVCLNRGCIPTKSLLNSAKLFKKSKCMEKFGIDIDKSHFNYSKALLWMNSTVTKLRENLTKLIKNAGIEVIYGDAEILKNKKVAVKENCYQGENIIIATGSSPIIPPIPGAHNALTSKEVLELEKCPDSLIIIGGGVIGIEFASFFSSIGVKVSVVEMENRILPNMDKRLTKVLQNSMNVDFYTSSLVTEIGNSYIKYRTKGEEIALDCDKVILAIGRSPNIEKFEPLGIVENRELEVNEFLETDIPGIFGVGDVTGISLLAHSAVHMGEVAAHNIFNDNRIKFNKIIPWVVYSDPEIASVGFTGDKAKKEGIPINKSVFKLDSNGRYLAENGEDKGVCIVITNKETDVILGIHMVGTGVSEIIGAGIIAINNKMTRDEFIKCILPHPTVGEVIKDALFYM